MTTLQCPHCENTNTWTNLSMGPGGTTATCGICGSSVTGSGTSSSGFRIAGLTTHGPTVIGDGQTMNTSSTAAHPTAASAGPTPGEGESWRTDWDAWWTGREARRAREPRQPDTTGPDHEPTQFHGPVSFGSNNTVTGPGARAYGTNNTAIGPGAHAYGPGSRTVDTTPPTTSPTTPTATPPTTPVVPPDAAPRRPDSAPAAAQLGDTVTVAEAPHQVREVHDPADPPLSDPPPADGWQRQGAEVSPGGDVGGDAQVSDAWDARWQRPLEDGTTALITRSYYVAADNPDGPAGGPTHLECQTEYLVCTDPTDPGSTEVWSDYTHATVPSIRRPTGEDAWLAATTAAVPTDDEWHEQAPDWLAEPVEAGQHPARPAAAATPTDAGQPSAAPSAAPAGAPTETSSAMPSGAAGSLAPAGEVTGHDSAKRYTDAMTRAADAAAASLEQTVAAMGHGRVSGPALAHLTQAREQAAQMAAALRAARGVLGRHDTVGEGYASAPDAGDKTWMTHE